MRIFAFHLLNDYSGSPKVLRQLALGWLAAGDDVTIVTSPGRTGFLSHIPGARYHFFPYRWAANPYQRLFNLVLSQVLLVITLFRQVKRGDILYINTVLPFGAAWLGYLRGCQVVYHIHETSMKPKLLKRFLFETVNRFAHQVIYVSEYLATAEPLRRPTPHTLHNTLDTSFLQTARAQRLTKRTARNFLMVCSLKDYKGVKEFIMLARHVPEGNFRLVVNASPQEIDRYMQDQDRPNNLEIFPTQVDVHPFYRWADVLLNLSHPDSWIETFGLTILEGQAYGLPAIVPPVGGVTELVAHDQNGFHVDSRNMKALIHYTRALLDDDRLYQRFHHKALQSAEQFPEQQWLATNRALLLTVVNLDANSGIRIAQTPLPRKAQQKTTSTTLVQE